MTTSTNDRPGAGKKKAILVLLFWTCLWMTAAASQRLTGFRALFDLSIETLYVDRQTCALHVVLKNEGAPLPEEIFLRGKLKCELESLRNLPLWPLKDADPGRLLNSKKRLDFDTKLVLNKKENVKVSLVDVLDRNPSNNQRSETVTPSSKCMGKTSGQLVVQRTSNSSPGRLEKPMSSAGKKQSSPSKKEKPRVWASENMAGNFLEPVKGDVIPFKGTRYNSLALRWVVPEEYLNRRFKAVFFFQNTSGTKWYIMDHTSGNYPYWLDRPGDFPPGDYEPSTRTLRVHDVYAGPATKVRMTPEGAVQDLPAGEYFARAEILDESRNLISSHSEGPFTVSEQTLDIDSGGIQPKRPWTTVENRPLVVETIGITLKKLEAEGINLLLDINGRTRDGKPVGDYCQGGVCGGSIGFVVTNITPGSDFGKSFSSPPYTLQRNRLRTDRNDPSRFGTMGNPLRITVNKPSSARDVKVKVTLSLDQAEDFSQEATFTVVEASGWPGGSGSGTVRADRNRESLDLEITSPADDEVLAAGTTKTLRWETPSRTGGTKRISYSPDEGRTWERVGEAQGQFFEWEVPHSYSERGRLKIEWYGDVPPENGGTLLNTKTKNIKIRGIRLTAPRGGEVLPRGGRFLIAWNASPPNAPVRLSWGEQRINRTIGCVTNTGIYSWSVPDSDSPRAFIKAELVGSCPDGALIGEDKSGAFSISSPHVKILSPRGAEQIRSGSTLDIAWSSSATEGMSLSGRITLSYKIGQVDRWTEIASNLPVSGSYRWTVPSVDADSSCVIKAEWIYAQSRTYTGHSLAFTIKR